MNSLFSDEFLAAIGHLSLDARGVAADVLSGAHASRAAGASLDFRDYRAYTPGDDLRRVDWNVFARTGHVFVRRFDHPAPVTVHILVDTSESMFCETPARFTLAAQLSAAIASAAVASHDDVTLRLLDQSPNTTPIRIRDRRRLPDMLDLLNTAKPCGPGSIVQGLLKLGETERSRGVVFVISDFFDDLGANRLADAISLLPQQLVLAQIVHPEDIEPSVDSELELVDSESSQLLVVHHQAIARYKLAYAAYQQTIEEAMIRRGGELVRFDSTSNVLDQLEKLFPGGVLRVTGRKQ